MHLHGQVNTTAAETLYSSIGDLIDADPARTTLVDVCCGTGSIGLTLANRSEGLRVYPGCGWGGARDGNRVLLVSI